MSCSIEVNENTASIEVIADDGVIIEDNTASVEISTNVEQVEINFQENVVIEAGPVVRNSDFQNLFIGYEDEFPVVAHQSLLYKKGDFVNHPEFFRKYLKVEL